MQLKNRGGVYPLLCSCIMMFLLQPVPSVALSAPFVTDAEVYMYFEDHCGIVDSPGTVVRFYHPQIAGIRIDGWPAVADARHHNCLECYVPEGRHKVIVDVRESPAVLSMREHVNGDRFYDQVCASADELERCAALAQPGDTLVIQNGVYENFEAMLTCSGREGRPIVIKPETPGGVEFCLQSRVTLKGDYLVLREFRFDHCETTRARAVAIEGSHNRMTQCQFFYCGNPVLSWSSIVSIEMEAHYNRVDHCYWTGSYSQSLVQRNDQRRPGTHGVGNRYDHNIFRDIIRIWENGQENIQLGQGRPHIAETHALVEYNLFDRAWGDGEICSNKTSSNTFRYNVAAWCPGSALTLRGGRNVLVSSNLFYRCGGGIRVFDRDHRIINNVIIDTDEPGIRLNIGHSAGNTPDSSLIAHNVISSDHGGLSVGGSTPRSDDDLPRNIRIVNNIFQGNNGILLDSSQGRNFRIDRNIVYASGSAEIGDAGEQAIIVDPKIDHRAPIGYPARSAAVRDRGRLLYEVGYDRNGVPRPIGNAPDIGAYELTGKMPDFAGLYMPPLPKQRPTIDTIIEQSKGRLLVPGDKSSLNEYWTTLGNVESNAGAYEVTDGSVRLLTDVPDDFIAEWDYQPTTFQAEGVAVFAGNGETSGYALSWGGAKPDGKPVGIIRLKKNGHLIATGPDAFFYPMNYYPIRYLNNVVRNPETLPDPSRWYHFRLMRRNSMITVLLNRQRSDWDEYGDVPAVVWHDTGERAGPVLDGSRFGFSQQGRGYWRNIRVWSAR